LTITRRHLLQSAAFATIVPALGTATGLPAMSPANAQTATGEPAWRHALSLFGDIKYPADFKRFD
jgi:microcin C transport system substrate-binding protein